MKRRETDRYIISWYSMSLTIHSYTTLYLCLSRRRLWEVKWVSSFSWGHITYYNMTACNRPWPDRTATNSLFSSFILIIYIIEWGEFINIIWWLAIVHDHIERSPIFNFLVFNLINLYIWMRRNHYYNLTASNRPWQDRTVTSSLLSFVI